MAAWSRDSWGHATAAGVTLQWSRRATRERGPTRGGRGGARERIIAWRGERQKKRREGRREGG
eukprot:3048236-Rhodomonas_salina.1